MVLSVVDANKPIKAITFDLDGTLWDLEPVIAEADRKLHEWFALHYPAISSAFSIYDMGQLRTKLLKQDPTLRHDVTELRKSSIRIAAEGARDRGVMQREPLMKLAIGFSDYGLKVP